MNRTITALGAFAAVGAFVVSACGGSGSAGSSAGSAGNRQGGNTGSGQDPTAQGPVTIAGASKGGTVTVLTQDGLTGTIDPSEIYYPDTVSIMSGLVTRSLTQYKYDPATRQMVLVPDLATDLGTHNDNYTQWTFTIRPGVRWENGQPVTATEVAWGMSRCMDAATFPTGACQYYSNVYYKDGSSDKGPYTSHQKPGTLAKAITVNGNQITIQMAEPFPDMPYWGTFPANGPIPLSAGPPTRRPTRTTRCRPVPTRSRATTRPASSCSSPTSTGTPAPTPRGRSTPAGTTSRAGNSRSGSTRSCSPTPAPLRRR